MTDVFPQWAAAVIVIAVVMTVIGLSVSDRLRKRRRESNDSSGEDPGPD